MLAGGPRAQALTANGEPGPPGHGAPAGAPAELESHPPSRYTRRVEILRTDALPFAVRYLISRAQELSDAHTHEVTSPAHVNAVLFQMKPVRDAVGAQISESSIETALMIEKKNAGRTGGLTNGLVDALRREDGGTLGFLRRYALGHPVASKPGLVIAAHAEAIAAALEAPVWVQLMTEPQSEEASRVAAFFTLGCGTAFRRKHAEVGRRHVVLAALETAQRVLRQHELEDTVAAPIAELEEVIARSAPKLAPSGGGVISPKRAGILAAAVAQGTEALRSSLADACAEGDSAANRAMESYHAALLQLAEHRASAATP